MPRKSQRGNKGSNHGFCLTKRKRHSNRRSVRNRVPSRSTARGDGPKATVPFGSPSKAGGDTILYAAEIVPPSQAIDATQPCNSSAKTSHVFSVRYAGNRVLKSLGVI